MPQRKRSLKNPHSYRLALSLAVAASLPPLAGSLSGCSVDILPVHSARVRSAKLAEQPLLRGPQAPGAFTYVWDFSVPQGFLFDPSSVSHEGGAVKLALGSDPAHPRPKTAMLVTNSGPPFIALDSFREVRSPDQQAASPSPNPQAAPEGRVVYQLSKDNSAWFYYDGHHWTHAMGIPSQANTAAQIQDAIHQFHVEVGTGFLYLKTFLVAPIGNETVRLARVQIQGIAPRLDGAD